LPRGLPYAALAPRPARASPLCAFHGRSRARHVAWLAAPARQSVWAAGARQVTGGAAPAPPGRHVQRVAAAEVRCKGQALSVGRATPEQRYGSSVLPPSWRRTRLCPARTRRRCHARGRDAGRTNGPGVYANPDNLARHHPRCRRWSRCHRGHRPRREGQPRPHPQLRDRALTGIRGAVATRFPRSL
jgi:hypothetical protein